MSLYSDFVGSSLKTYSTVGELPLSSNGTGDQAFVTANNPKKVLTEMALALIK